METNYGSSKSRQYHGADESKVSARAQYLKARAIQPVRGMGSRETNEVRALLTGVTSYKVRAGILNRYCSQTVKRNGSK